MQSMTEEQFVYSDFGDDPDLGGLVEMFVEELPNRIADLKQLASNQDWEAVRRGAHQLKGAGGSYGFGPVTTVGFVLERKCKENAPEDEILRALEELELMCNRVRAGVAL